MQLDIVLQNEPLFLAEVKAMENAGAVVRFEGRVRAEEKGTLIAALEYEAHTPMAQKQMERIALELNEQHACLAVRVHHRLGRVPVGEAAILVEVCAKHRGEAFAFLAEFMNRLKQDVPIWKAAP